MKCVVCDKRKGRRFCPAKERQICAQCCGGKRVIEIDCPESCEFLRIGREREAALEGARHFQSRDPMEQERRSRILESCEPVIVKMQTLIAVERKSSRDLKDADVAEALDCLLKTLRTEDRGVIYETTSENLRAEGLRRQLGALITACRYPKDAGAQRIQLKDAVDCLELMRSVVASHLESGPASLSFVDFLLRYLPRSPRIETSGSSIIIPGR